MNAIKWSNYFVFHPRLHCALCQSTQFRVKLNFDDLTIQECLQCGYVFMNPYLSEESSLKLFAGNMGQHFPWLIDYEKVVSDKPESTRTFKAYTDVLTYLNHQVPEKGSLLDVGCGAGLFLSMAQKSGWKAQGIDFNANLSESLKSKYQFEVREGKLDEIPFCLDAFDVITLWDYFEHVENPIKIIQKIRQILKPGGILIIACPNHHSLLFLLIRILYKCTPIPFFLNLVRMIYPPTHLSYFSPSLLIRTMANYNFKQTFLLYDETDLNRVRMRPSLRFLTSILFSLARPIKLSNRFILGFQKNL